MELVPFFAVGVAFLFFALWLDWQDRRRRSKERAEAAKN